MIMYRDNDAFVGYDKFIMDKFEFESGRVLENVEVEYTARGTPKYDEDGKICNALVYCHTFNGNYSSVDHIHKLVAEGKPFDLNEFYIISTTSLGFPESCSPSTTNLKHNFPKYTIKDRVNFKRQFLRERFGIEKVYGIISKGVGGYDAYTWACEYPDEMKFIMVAGSCFKTNGYRYVVSKCMESIIESSDDFYSEIYSDSLSRMMVSINRLLYSNYFSKKIFSNLSNDQIDVLMDDFVDEGLFVDIYDFKLRNDAVLEYDVEDKLKNIKAETLVISSNDDMYYTPELDVMPLNDLIENVTIVTFESDITNINYDDGAIVEKEIREFINKVKNKYSS